jgi:hypothetical protein
MATDLDVRRMKFATKVKWGLGLGSALIAGPVLFTLFSYLAGAAIAAVTTIVIVGGAINYYPVFAMKLANSKIKEIVKEAKKNPIETMIQQAQQRKDALERTKQSITTTRVEVTTFKRKAENMSQKFGKAEAETFLEQAKKMERLLLFRVEKWTKAKEELKAYEQTIEIARAKWEMSLEAQKLNKMAGFQEDDFMEKLKTEVSLESVNKSLEVAFSEMESSLMEEGSHIPDNYTPSIEFKPMEQEFIDADVVDERQFDLTPLKVKRGGRA